MKLLVIVLNKIECLDKMLSRFSKNNIAGATILDSKGMAQELSGTDNDMRIIGSLRLLFNPAHKENKTIFMVTADDKVDEIIGIVNETTGGLDRPDTGILFTVPIDRVEGLREAEKC